MAITKEEIQKSYEQGYSDGMNAISNSERDAGEKLGAYVLARKLTYLIDEIAIASENGDTEKRWVMIEVAKDILNMHFTKEADVIEFDDTTDPME